jgi:hypothetical protein
VADSTSLTLPDDAVVPHIHIVRGHRVMRDGALARLYAVPTKALVQAVKRNPGRFPIDFMFHLDAAEFDALRSQTVTSTRQGGRRYAPYVFTEQGVAMLSSVLRSERAVEVNIEIMRAFVRLRQMLTQNAELARKMDAMEKKYDTQFKVVFDAIRQLMMPSPDSPRPRIGFQSEESDRRSPKKLFRS